jgi:hypothetical protein
MRSVKIQGNVTGTFRPALRQSEAELACSEFGIITTQSSKARRPPKKRENRSEACLGGGNRGGVLCSRRETHL